MRKIWLVLAMLALVSAPAGFAQKKGKGEESGRTVRGVVTAADGSVVGLAVVQLKNTKTQQIRSFYTKEDGSYYFHGLSMDDSFELKADYQGASSSTRTLSPFDTRKEAILNLKLNPKK